MHRQGPGGVSLHCSAEKRKQWESQQMEQLAKRNQNVCHALSSRSSGFGRCSPHRPQIFLVLVSCRVFPTSKARPEHVQLLTLFWDPYCGRLHYFCDGQNGYLELKGRSHVRLQIPCVQDISPWPEWLGIVRGSSWFGFFGFCFLRFQGHTAFALSGVLLQSVARWEVGDSLPALFRIGLLWG